MSPCRPPRGVARRAPPVYIDGVYKTTINLRSTSTLYKVKVYDAPPLSNAQHTLRMDAAGTANSAGSGVGLDHIVLR